MSAPSCPTPQRLQQFLLGQISDADAEDMGKHLAECPRCLQVLETLGDEDALSRAVHTAQSMPFQVPRPDAVEGLIDRLSKQRPAPLPPVGEATDSDNGADTAQRQAADAELCAFLSPPQAPDEIGRLGSYRVLKVLGAGGMGVVFQAEDPSLHRLVALKTLRPGTGLTEVNRKRFLREAQATAQLEHDHIVPIYQVGEVEGIPFLAMQFLKGETLEAHLRAQKRLPLAEVLRIGREIAEGLAAAHQHQLIHRDIKPSNVWLEAGSGRVKIVDFGLARESTDSTHLTATGFVVGTPGFMPPEQARGQPVDARGDLFSLGCILYQMATGTVPFHGSDTLGVLVAVATDTPTPPGELNPALPPALSELIMRMLAKDPVQRPPSARVVIQTLDAVATGKPPPKPPSSATASTLAYAPARKSRWPVLAGVVAALVVVGVGGYLALLRPGSNLGRLVIDTDDTNFEVVIHQGDAVIQAQTSERQFELPAGDYLVTVIDVQEDQPRISKPVTVARRATQTVDVAAWLGEVLDPPPPIGLAPLPPDQGTVQIEGGNENVKVLIKQAGEIRVEATSERHFRLPPGTYDVELVGTWPSLELVPSRVSVKAGEETPVALRTKAASEGSALGGPLSLVSRPVPIPGVRSWAVETRGHRGPVRTVAYSPNGRWLATAGADGTIRVWDAGSSKLVRAFLSHIHPIEALSWATDNSTLVSLARDGTTVRFWEASSGRRRRLMHLPGEVNAIAVSPDGKMLAAAAVDGSVQLWDPADKARDPVSLMGHKGEVRAVAWSPDGKVLASAGADRAVLLWTNPADKPKPRRLTEHKDIVLSLAWSLDGKVLASAGKDHKLVLSDVEQGKVLRSFAWEPAVVKGKASALAGPGALSWSKTKTLASIGSDGVQLWKLESDKAVRTIAFTGRALSWAADGKTLALAGNDDESVRLCDTGTSQVRVGMPGIKVERITATAWSPDGKRLAAQGERTVWLWSTADGKLQRTLEGHGNHLLSALAWSPDGKRLATSGGNDAKVLIWDAASGKPKLTLKVTQQHAGLLAWSPDGKILVAAGKSYGSAPNVELYLWDAESGKELRRIGGHTASVTGLAWSPDSKVIISSSADTSVRFWSVRSGKLLRSIRPYSSTVWSMALSPDGKVLATAGDNPEQVLRLYDAHTGGHLHDLPGQRGRVLGLSWLPDGQTLAVCSDDHYLRLLDVRSGALQRSVPERSGGAVFLPERGLLAGSSPAHGLRLRDLAANRAQATLLLSRQGGQDAYLAITAEGHYYATPRLESELVYVYQGERGVDLLLPDEFAAKFNWKNDPKQVRLVPGKDEK